MNYFCCNENRRNAISGHPALNGIDFLEVQDDPGMPNALRQRTLFVHFVNPLSVTLSSTNVRIEGGERIKNVLVIGVDPTSENNVLAVSVDKPGDFSTYTLLLVQDADHLQPPGGYDALLSSVDFSFKVECPNDFDCLPQQVCPPEVRQEPAIDYLARDYASFRRVMLDRMSLLVPQWKERNPADASIVLVELLAYVGDYLSYRQDAIATEAYPGTARRRVSIRRHARLVDYAMHDGCNARVWVQIQVSNDITLADKTQLLTRIAGKAEEVSIPPNSRDYEQALLLGSEVFETMPQQGEQVQGVQLFAAHNTLFFYTWGDQNCCLPAGATRATLLGHLPDLQIGHVLIFQEQLGPHTGVAGDADPAHRHAVRLTSRTANSDPLGGFFLHPPVNTPVDVTEITWDAADALPFALCISAHTDKEHGDRDIADVSVALGNIVLADHGRTVSQQLGYVPQAALARVQPGSGNRCQPAAPVLEPPRFRPRLQIGPLTQVGRVTKVTSTGGSVLFAGRKQEQVVPLDPDAPAATAMQWDITLALPEVSVTDSDSFQWGVQRDLFDSNSFSRDFVAEVEEDGLATLRFGDDIYGMRPKADDTSKPAWMATYRVGNGVQGNVGTGTLAHIVSNDPAIIAVNNPLPAQGGIDPESIENVRQRAPFAFRTQERAVTLDDYGEIAQRHPGVQKAVATYRWTGSWRTVFLSIDRLGGLDVDDDFKDEMQQFLERYRLEGQDIEINGPHYVSLEIEMKVCVKSGYFWGDVEAALLRIFSNRLLPDGRRGLFHPDNFTFGQAVYLSPLYAAAQAVAGVSFVEITTFQRWGVPSTAARDDGVLQLDPLEIARLDNDPNFPEHGVFRVGPLN